MMEGAQAPAELQPHAHHAIQITFRLKGGFEIGVAGQRLAGPVAVVGSDVRHTFQAAGVVAILFVAPESAAGRAMGAALFIDRPWANLTEGPLVASIDALLDCFDRGGVEAGIRDLGRTIIDRLPAATEAAPADARVLAMVEFARRNLERTVTLPAAAAVAKLSPGRASHVFVAQTRLPFRTYVLWLRLERAVAHYAAGCSLTEAAHEAGFADSAHFSRTFRRTFGLPAAALRLDHG